MKKPIIISQLMNYCNFCMFNMRHNIDFVFSFTKVSCRFTQKSSSSYLVYIVLSAYSVRFFISRLYHLNSLLCPQSSKPHMGLMKLIFNGYVFSLKCYIFSYILHYIHSSTVCFGLIQPSSFKDKDGVLGEWKYLCSEE
jgi:hypothetical protein